eukprot:266662_1
MSTAGSAQQLELHIKETNTTHKDEEKELTVSGCPSHPDNSSFVICVDDIMSMHMINTHNQRTSTIKYTISETHPLSKCRECKIRIEYISRRELHNLFLIILGLILLTVTFFSLAAFIKVSHSIVPDSVRKHASNIAQPKHLNLSQMLLCNGQPLSLIGWYDVSSYEHHENVWYDRSSHTNNVNIMGSMRVGVDIDNSLYLFGFATDFALFTSVFPQTYDLIYVLSSDVIVTRNASISWDIINPNQKYWEVRGIVVMDASLNATDIQCVR